MTEVNDTDTFKTNGTWYYVVVAGNAYYNSTVSNCVSVVVAIPLAPSIHWPISYTVAWVIDGVAALVLVINRRCTTGCKEAGETPGT